MADMRVCCLNVLWGDDTKVEVFRNPTYNYRECIKWPPANAHELLCHHCCLAPEGTPVPMCVEYDKKTDRYFCQGFFCGFPCAKAYILDSFRFTAGEFLLYLDHMAWYAFGQKGAILPAPPRNRLKMFGGDLSIDEFRSGVASADIQLSMPLTASPLLYERHTKIQQEIINPHKRPKKAPDSIGKYVEEPLYEAYMKQSCTSSASSSNPDTAHKKKGTLSAYMKTVT